MGSRRGVGPGQGGADTAARTGDENGAGIPHPFICIAFDRENIDTVDVRYRGLGKRRLWHIFDHKTALS
jgi:hypothetical protein